MWMKMKNIFWLIQIVQYFFYLAKKNKEKKTQKKTQKDWTRKLPKLSMNGSARKHSLKKSNKPVS